MKTSNSKQLYFRMLSYLKPYIGLFIVGIVATVILALTQPAIAAMMKPLLDGAFVEKDQAFIVWMPIILIILFSLRGLSSFASSMAFAWVSNKVVMDFRLDMFSKVLTLPTRFFDEHTVGSIISKFTNDVAQVTASATTVLVTMIRDTVQVIGLTAWMIYIDWKLSLLLLALVPLLAAVIHVLGKRLRNMSTKLQDSFGELNHVLSESIRGQKEVKIFGAQGYENQRMRDTANWVRRYQMKFQAASSISVPLVEIISAIVMAFIVYLSASRIENDSMTVGESMSFFAALGLLLAPIKRLTKVNEPLQRSLAAAESIFTLIDTPGEVETARETTGDTFEGRISFENISFSYGNNDKLAIDQLSLEIPAHQTIALVGSSGSGKTTLANLIPRLYDVSSGKISIDGKDIHSISLTDLRNNIALVSQDVILFNDTVAANISYGEAKETDNKRLIAAIRAANAENFIKEMPDGMQTLLGENGLRLSGGQRQRIAIARALYKNAPILILDEATSALDSESEKLVQEALENLKRNRTTIIIAHRLSTIENADRIVVMEKGKIVESGTHQELLARQGAYAKLYNTQYLNATS